MERSAPSSRGLLVAALIVFIVAVSARLSSCYESLWVDELHSAWCVWDSLGDVAPRASIGHQSPFYFYGLWFWRCLVGDGELALRMSSVLAVAAAASVTTFSVSRWTRSCVAGVVAGLVIALEGNSLFFGTELRPYSLVILFMAIATACFVRLLDVGSRHDDRWAWLGLGTATLLMALCHPTSLGVAAWLAVALLVRWSVTDRSGLFKFNLIDLCLLVGCVAVGLTLWNTILADTWQQRGSWRSFAQATRIDQLWGIWDWTYLLVLPLLLSIIAVLLGRENRDRKNALGTVASFALLCIVSTTVFWIASKADWVHLWHRRYLVAVLPMFACVVGGSLSMERVPSAMAKWLRPVAGCALLLALLFSQGLLASLDRYPPVFVRRGEDWRGAIEFLRSEARLGDELRLDAGLIESRTWVKHRGGAPYPMSDQEAYLLFPVSGPYRVGTEKEYGRYHQKFFPDDADWSMLRGLEFHRVISQHLGEPVARNELRKRYLLLTRRWANRVELPVLEGFDIEAATIRSFGGVSIIVLPRRPRGD